MPVSSRRCVVLLTALLLFWVVFVGTIVSHPPDSLATYASRFSAARQHTGAGQTPVSVDADADSHEATELTGSIPLKWMHNPQLATGDGIQIQASQNQAVVPTQEVHSTHNELFSHLTPRGEYFRVYFGDGNTGINPNIIPHPHDANVWIIVAQEYHGSPADDNQITPWSVELVCNANFTGDATLRCTSPPKILPIAATPFSSKCPSEMEIVNMGVGPHDARVFYGPGIPYATYGSQSQYSCLGQFVQDFRYLVDWGAFRMATDKFALGTDIQRPNAGPMEKNFFLFWDLHGSVYAHYDLHPKRAFAKLDPDGTASVDLAPRAKDDAQCWQRHLDLNPLPANVRSSIHQATNSLAITLCDRSDSACTPTADNTFILHIYQHKIYSSMFHSRYEPFVALFRPTAPFGLHAISARPFWIHGRRDADQMLYITSMSWRAHGQTYHGFLDDTLFVAFGIDDRDTGAIDVTARELLGELMPCSDNT